MPSRPKALWRCPLCGEGFTTRNQWHSCGKFDLEALFEGEAPEVRTLYQKFVELVERCGPVAVIPQKSRIAFQVRMRFAALMPQKAGLKGHLVLAERRESPCFEKIESFSKRPTSTSSACHRRRISRGSSRVSCAKRITWARESTWSGLDRATPSDPRGRGGAPEHKAALFEVGRHRRSPKDSTATP